MGTSKIDDQVMRYMLGVVLFMEVTMNHGDKYMNPAHPDFESKRLEVMKKIEDALDADEGTRIALMLACKAIRAAIKSPSGVRVKNGKAIH